ncbi:uncharacterized protein [Prorops nasuta]|uniref:uncharacterized protein n=1 Tax=Prorops nasuta TaxID=863751 RepID=UPI0034CF5F8A
MRWNPGLFFTTWLILLIFVENHAQALQEARGCNRTIRNSIGWIRWTGRMGKCVIRIRTPLRDPQVIELKVRRMQVGYLRDSKCQGAYIQFSDGVDESSSVDQTGRYCGHVTANVTRLFLKKGPDLDIIMDSDSSFAMDNPVLFSAQFSLLPASLAAERYKGSSQFKSHTECPLECSVRNEKRSCRLTSPGYPGFYPRGIRCRIAFESTLGRFKIGSQLDDAYNLMNYTSQLGCQTENCEQHVENSLGESGRRKLKRKRWLEPTWKTERDEDDELLIAQQNKRRNSGPLKGDETIDEDYDDSSVKIRHSKKQKFLSRKQSRVNNADRNLDDIEDPQFYYRLQSYNGRHRNVCVGDYLAVLENVNGTLYEIWKFCGSGHVPRILSRGRNVIVEFKAENDGTIMHDGFQLTLQETESRTSRMHRSCEFVYKSTDRKQRESIESPRSWFPPQTTCNYRFIGRTNEKISVRLTIVRHTIENEIGHRRNFSINYCPGNEIVVYNGAQANTKMVIWSFCDESHKDINDLQVPLTSNGNALLIRYYSAKGSFDGQEFTYSISYKFVKRAHKFKIISLKPVNFTALNLNGTENCDCDFADRIGNFKSWFMVLVFLGVISFLAAVLTIIGLLAKCLKIKAMERKLNLQSTKQ